MSIRSAFFAISCALLALSGCASGNDRPTADGGGLDDAGGDATTGDAGVDPDGSLPDGSLPDGSDLCLGVDCSAFDDECNMGSCDPATGACTATPIPDGTACDDADACTDADVCSAGVCGGAALDCSALDDMCNAGTCDPATGACAAAPIADGTACDDADACTDADVCSAGTCAGAALDCSALDDTCNAGACDPATGACAAAPLADGTACDDGVACTAADVCSAGACAGAAIDCSALSDACNAGVCDPATGACAAAPVADGTACDDGSACTSADACAAGACAGAVIDCSALTDACNAGVCDPATGACAAIPVANGTACDDGSACTSADVCTAGACAGAAIDCSALTDACNAGSCDPTTGACTATPVADGTACDDGLTCSLVDSCVAGACVSSGVRFDFESGITHEWTMTGGTTGWIIDPSGMTGSGFSNADITDSQTAVAQLDVVYPIAGSVSFWRRTSTESNWDYLYFYIDGIQQARWSGTNAFAQFTYPVAAGAHVLEWRYTKDGSVSRGTDTVTIDDIDLTGGHTRQTFERGIPSSFVMSGNANWVVSTTAQAGMQAMQSGVITHNQSSIATTTVSIPVAGTVSFWRRTSTESSFDYLRFYVDGAQVGSWSGTVAYSEVSFPLSAGEHTLEWRYTKDGSVNSGADTVYVDNIDIVLNPCP